LNGGSTKQPPDVDIQFAVLQLSPPFNTQYWTIGTYNALPQWSPPLIGGAFVLDQGADATVIGLQWSPPLNGRSIVNDRLEPRDRARLQWSPPLSGGSTSNYLFDIIIPNVP
jgi:hypothetical protein